MSAVLLVECSPRFARSRSRAAAEQLVDRLKRRQPGLRLLRRDLAVHPPPLIDEAFSEAIRIPAAEHTPAQRQALEASEALIAELEATSVLVIGTPMHNFTVPAPLKAWVDQVLRIGRTFRRTPAGKAGLLADRPAYVVVATGGFIAGERARQPDFLTPYLGAVLATLGIREPRFLHLEAAEGRSERSRPAEAELRSWLDTHLPLAAGAE